MGSALRGCERGRQRLAAASLVVAGLLTTGCAEMAADMANDLVQQAGDATFRAPAHLTNLSEGVCADSFATALAATLVEQGESAADAEKAAGTTLRETLLVKAREWEVLVASGNVYRFDLKVKQRTLCVLRLYGRTRRGGATVTNTITYFAKAPLAGCSCRRDRGAPFERPTEWQF